VNLQDEPPLLQGEPICTLLQDEPQWTQGETLLIGRAVSIALR
jgi:hypothetical protein